MRPLLRRAAPHPSPEPRAEPDRADFRALMIEISRGSRVAFKTLFDETAGPIGTRLETQLRDRGRAAGIVAATYIEVWWLAGCHTGPDDDILRWIDDIVERRLTDVTRPRNERSDPRSHRAALELADLLDRPIWQLDPH